MEVRFRLFKIKTLGVKKLKKDILNQKEILDNFNKAHTFVPDFETTVTASLFDKNLQKIVNLIERLQKTIEKNDLQESFWIDYEIEYQDNNMLSGMVDLTVKWEMNELTLDKQKNYELIAQVRKIQNRTVTNIFSPDYQYKDLQNVISGEDKVEFNEVRCESCHKKIKNRNNMFIVKNRARNQIEYYGSNCIDKIIPVEMIKNVNVLIDKLFKVTEEVGKLKNVPTDTNPYDILDMVWKRLTSQTSKYSMENLAKTSNGKTALFELFEEKNGKVKDSNKMNGEKVDSDKDLLIRSINSYKTKFEPNKEDFIGFIKKGRKIGTFRNNAREILKPQKDSEGNMIKSDIQKEFKKALYNSAIEYWNNNVLKDVEDEYNYLVDFRNKKLNEVLDKKETDKKEFNDNDKLNNYCNGLNELNSRIRENILSVSKTGQEVSKNKKINLRELSPNLEIKELMSCLDVHQTDTQINISLNNKHKTSVIIDKLFETKLENHQLDMIVYSVISYILYKNYGLPLKEIKGINQKINYSYKNMSLEDRLQTFTITKSPIYDIFKNNQKLLSSSEQVIFEKMQNVKNIKISDKENRDKTNEQIEEYLKENDLLKDLEKVNIFEICLNKIVENYNFDLNLDVQGMSVFSLVNEKKKFKKEPEMNIDVENVRLNILNLGNLIQNNQKEYDECLSILNINKKEYPLGNGLKKVYYFSKNQGFKKPYDFIKMLATPPMKEITKDQEQDLLKRTLYLIVNNTIKDFKEPDSKDKIQEILNNIYGKEDLANKSNEELAKMILVNQLYEIFKGNKYKTAKIK